MLHAKFAITVEPGLMGTSTSQRKCPYMACVHSAQVHYGEDKTPF